MKKAKDRVSKIFAHGAIHPARSYTTDYMGRFVEFGASSADACDYPVQFDVKKLPALIKWLQKEYDICYGEKPAKKKRAVKK